MRFLSAIWELMKASFNEWNDHNAPRLGAALAYYTVLSLAPLAVLTLAIVSFAFSREAAQTQIMDQVNGLMGPLAARAVQGVLQSAQQPGKGLVAGAISVVLLLVGASGVLSELRDALNIIWDAKPQRSSGILEFLKHRLVSFAMVLGVGFVLLVSLLLSTALSAIGRAFQGMLPVSEAVLQTVNFVVSYALITLLFALIYKVIPDRSIQWSDVWMGAAITALLFDAGKTLLGLYLGKTTAASAYGAAGSVVILLIWVYYSAQILFFGAEFAQQFACRYGSRSPAACGEEKRPQPHTVRPKTRTAP